MVALSTRVVLIDQHRHELWPVAQMCLAAFAHRVLADAKKADDYAASHSAEDAESHRKLLWHELRKWRLQINVVSPVAAVDPSPPEDQRVADVRAFALCCAAARILA